MKKFEIINGKWIKSIPQYHGETCISSLEIKSISLIQSITASEQHERECHARYYISLFGASNGVKLTFQYKTEEATQFYSDLKFLENLIYNK